MAKHPVMMEYSYELKENLTRRAIALFIDLATVGSLLFVLFVFLGLGLLQANPMNALFGLLGPIFYQQQVEGVRETSPFIAMIMFVILQSFLLPLYYTFFESNSRRTLGKKLMHLDPIRSDNMFPTRWDALQRNYLKYFAGAVGGYLLGFLGWFLLIGVACLIDLKMAPEYKLDLRQRATEVPFSTAVLVERPKVRLGEISIEGGKWARLREKEKKARKYAARLKRESRTKKKMDKVHNLEDLKKEKIKKALSRTEKETEKILQEVKRSPDLSGDLPGKVRVKSEKTLLKRPENEEMEEEELGIEIEEEKNGDRRESPLLVKKSGKKITKAPKEQEEGPAEVMEKEDTAVGVVPEEGTVEKEEKVPFWKKLFGLGYKKEMGEEEEEGKGAGDLAEKKEGGGISKPLAAELPPVKKDSGKDEVVLNFMFEFDIDEERAKGLYDMGYRKKEDLKDAIPQDLMMIKGLNPTIAKRILKRSNA